MGDFQAPSFSLGLDLDSHSSDEAEAPSFSLARNESESILKDQSSFAEFNSEDEDSDSVRVFKRLRRGPSQCTTPKTSANMAVSCISENPMDCNGVTLLSADEDFRRENRQPRRSARLKGRTEFSLPSESVATNQAFQDLPGYTPPPSISSFSGKQQNLLMRNPRKLFCNYTDKNVKEASFLNKGINNCKREPCLIETKGISLPTAASDELCDKYVSGRNSSIDLNSDDRKQNNLLPSNTVSPASFYFDNEDIRIRKLLREHLPHFLPVGRLLQGGEHETEPVHIDYLSQFSTTKYKNFGHNAYSHGHMSNNAKKKPTSMSLRGGKGKALDDKVTGSWVNMAKKVTKPVTSKDGKERKPFIKGQQKGYWFTNEYGRKIYVNKHGHELSGRRAYLSYKRENCSQFWKPQKKGKRHSAKKKRC